MSDFIAVAKTSEIPESGKLLVEVDEQLVVLFRIDDQYYCLDDVCTHDGGPLSEGAVDAADCTIACPRHGAKFDVRDGRALTMPATKATVAHDVKVEGDQIFVRFKNIDKISALIRKIPCPLPKTPYSNRSSK